MYTDSSRAALLFSLEVVYCAGLGYLFLSETLSSTELLGCALMLAAAVLSSTSESAHSEDDDVTVELVESQYQDESSRSPYDTRPGGRIVGVRLQNSSGKCIRQLPCQPVDSSFGITSMYVCMYVRFIKL